MLEEADYSLTQGAFEGTSGRYKNDDILLVKFFKSPMFNMTKSHEAGRPIYDEVDNISIITPGNKDSVVVRPATDMDKQRFSRHWKAYTERVSQEALDGTPLSEWPGITRAMVEELRFFNVLTVEQLVGMSDANSGKLMGINLLKQRAAAYLEASKDNALSEQLVASNARVDELSEQLAELQAYIKANTGKKKSKEIEEAVEE